MPSDVWISADGKIYVADSESDMTQNPGWEKGIRVGDVETGWVEHFILDMGDNPPITQGGSGAESLAVDRHGSIFAGEPRPQRLRKYIKVALKCACATSFCAKRSVVAESRGAI